MATLTIDTRSGKTAGYNIQWYEGKCRRTLYLGGSQYNKKTAERVKQIVETLQYYRRNEITTPEKTVENWLQNAPDDLKSKLAQAGFIAVTKAKTCKELWDFYMKHKTGVADETIRLYSRCQVIFFETFSEKETVETITTSRLLDWKALLLTKYAVASVASYLSMTRAVLNWAVDQEWLTKSPMAKNKVPIGSFVNRDNDRTISMAEYAKLLDVCPNQEWRTIIALARIGGLRCPSELKRLQWTDINWAENRFLVRAKKTERYDNHRERVVPLFPELLVELRSHFESDDSEGNEFVIQSFQGTSWQVFTPFQKIACNAGLGTIDRPFDSLRTARSNEVRIRWGEVKESLWIGHSERTMKKHYLRFSDEEFAEAAGVSLVEENSHAKSHAISPVYSG
jgi:integrase